MSYIVDSVWEYNGKFYINGVCHCGFGANMPWMIVLPDGSKEPCCNKCQRGDTSGYYKSISKSASRLFKSKVRIVI